MVLDTQHANNEATLAKPVAADDLCRGDFVAVLNEIHEYPSFLWACDTNITQPKEPVRIRWQSFDVGTPLRVIDLCLPFVFVKRPGAKYRTLDLRRVDLVRLDRSYAKRVWNAIDGRKRKRRRRRSAKNRE
jgi:hypothetical protein